MQGPTRMHARHPRVQFCMPSIACRPLWLSRQSTLLSNGLAVSAPPVCLCRQYCAYLSATGGPKGAAQAPAPHSTQAPPLHQSVAAATLTTAAARQLAHAQVCMRQVHTRLPQCCKYVLVDMRARVYTLMQQQRSWRQCECSSSCMHASSALAGLGIAQI